MGLNRRYIQQNICVFLIGLFIASFGVLWQVSPVQAVVPRDIAGVTVAISAHSATTSNITLVWDPVPPANGGTVSYDLEKSTDGGVTFSLAANVGSSPWTDTNSGAGVSNYTNVIYRLRAKETVGATTYYSANFKTVNVFPPDLNAHDNYQRNTDLCHSCHSAHTAQAPFLLSQATATAVCMTCHEGLTNSKYDVVNGYTKVSGGNARSAGGAFAHNGVQGDVWNGASTTSAHKVDEVTKGSAPGGANVEQTLGCTTCHSGHDTGNYRMLNKSITVPTGTNTVITVNLNIQAGAATASATSGESSVYLSGTTVLCQSCHADYAAGAGSGGSGTPPSSTYGTPGTYRHAIGVSPSSKSLATVLPLEGTARNNTDKMVCLTCHYAHGTVAGDSTVSTVVSGDGSTLKTQISSTLKRLDGMGVCEDCHKK
ncbi:MAG: cytochrome c3 family protein [Desulfitobacteriaceae bacterium]